MVHRDARNRLGPSVAGLNHDSTIEAQVLTTSPARAPRAASRRGALLWEVDLARLGPALQAARATCAKCLCRKTQRFQSERFPSVDGMSLTLPPTSPPLCWRVRRLVQHPRHGGAVPRSRIRYVAELIGADTDCERTIRWLIALLAGVISYEMLKYGTSSCLARQSCRSLPGWPLPKILR